MLFTFTTENYAQALSIIVGVLVAIGTISALATARARRRGIRTLSLSAAKMLSAAWVTLCALGAAFVIANTFSSQTIVLTEPMRGWMSGAQDTLESPMCDVPAGAEWYDCGGTVDSVAIGPRLVLGAGALLSLVAYAYIGRSVYVAAARTVAGTPFDRAVGASFRNSAIVVLIGGLAGHIMQGGGQLMAVRALDWNVMTTPPAIMTLPWWPFLVSLGLFALAAIFRYGGLLEADRERLAKETEGLV